MQQTTMLAWNWQSRQSGACIWCSSAPSGVLGPRKERRQTLLRVSPDLLVAVSCGLLMGNFLPILTGLLLSI